jgi:2-(3-amino-3-carboxypropyl)histidine synthase
MKQLFIPAKSELDLLPVVKRAKKQLKGKIGIVTTVQHLHKLKEVKEYLQKEGFNVKLLGQVLGCNANNAKVEVESLMYIGTGEFHPKGIYLETSKEVLSCNPLTKEVKIVGENDVQKIKRRQKGALLKFLTSKVIGILVSTKNGQRNISEVKTIQNKYPDKEFYIFESDTLDFNELENFNFIDCWVNTMCKRIGLDDTKRTSRVILNIDVIKSLEVL